MISPFCFRQIAPFSKPFLALTVWWSEPRAITISYFFVLLKVKIFFLLKFIFVFNFFEFSFAFLIEFEEKSIASTLAPQSAKPFASSPVPQPSSRTVFPLKKEISSPIILHIHFTNCFTFFSVTF